MLPGKDAGVSSHGRAALGGQDEAGRADGRGVWESVHDLCDGNKCLTILGTVVSTIVPVAVGAVRLEGGAAPRAALVRPANVVGCRPCRDAGQLRGGK